MELQTAICLHTLRDASTRVLLRGGCLQSALVAIGLQGAQRASRCPAPLLAGIYLSNILTSVSSPAGSFPSIPLAAAVPTAGGAASMLLSAQCLLPVGCGWHTDHPGSGRAVRSPYKCSVFSYTHMIFRPQEEGNKIQPRDGCTAILCRVHIFLTVCGWRCAAQALFVCKTYSAIASSSAARRVRPTTLGIV